MPDATRALTPYEAALAANNAYYTLKGWASGKPTPGKEDQGVVDREVTGSGDYSLRKAGVQATRPRTFEGTTGLPVATTRTGFGYVLSFADQGENHVIVATRGTRTEIGKADLLTDLYATPTASFMDAGLVHRGFSLTFQSIRGALDASTAALGDADHIHCVGHSLGGAVANLVAYYLGSKYGGVRLYTFGAPRVGVFGGLPIALEKKLGKSNIFRVSHDMDPIAMIPTFPFVHVLAADDDAHNFYLRSPATLPTLDNHNMATYAKEMANQNWEGVGKLKYLPNFEDKMMKGLWESEADGWFRKGMRLVGGAAVWVLMKILRGILDALLEEVVSALIGVATPLDLIARMLYAGYQLASKLGAVVLGWIKAAAAAIGQGIEDAKDVTVAFLRYVLERLWRTVRQAAESCLDGLEKAAERGFAPPLPGALALGRITRM
jgi:hypothetical protein